jgi:hypothetical protein
LGVELEIVVVFPLELLVPFSSPDWFDEQIKTFLFQRFESELHGLNFDKAVGLGDFLELERSFDEGEILN